MEIEIVHALKGVVLPPGLNFLAVFLGALFLPRKQPFACFVIGITFGLLVALSLPLVARHLINTVETYEPLDVVDIGGSATAIVVLGAGHYRYAPEYGSDTVSAAGLQRLRYTAWLHSEIGLPILVSGGSVFGDRISEARLMGEILVREFAVPVEWLEVRSRNTEANAALSAKLLFEQSINEIVLVTHAAHMSRAVRAFERAGLVVLPAPIGFASLAAGPLWLECLPTAAALALSRTALYELLGQLWYRVRY